MQTNLKYRAIWFFRSPSVKLSRLVTSPTILLLLSLKLLIERIARSIKKYNIKPNRKRVEILPYKKGVNWDMLYKEGIHNYKSKARIKSLQIKS